MLWTLVTLQNAKLKKKKKKKKEKKKETKRMFLQQGIEPESPAW